MVKGLERFRDHFSELTDRYVIIGGTACDLSISGAGLEFRATKDIDIVLCLETMDTAFAAAFWSFVRDGEYESQETSDGARRFYRFKKPKAETYPFMLELFSRVPDLLGVEIAGHLTPIPVDDEVSSLSAILLDGDYYAWTHSGKIEIDGLPIVRPEHLIPLKAKAWLDLTGRADEGHKVDSKDIRKHKNGSSGIRVGGSAIRERAGATASPGGSAPRPRSLALCPQPDGREEAGDRLVARRSVRGPGDGAQVLFSSAFAPAPGSLPFHRARHRPHTPEPHGFLKRHKNDVFRLYAITDPEYRPNPAESIQSDMRQFIQKMQGETIDLKSFGLASASLDSVLDTLDQRYVLSEPPQE